MLMVHFRLKLLGCLLLILTSRKGKFEAAKIEFNRNMNKIMRKLTRERLIN